MSSKLVIWAIIVVGIVAGVVFGIHKSSHFITLKGAIIRKDSEADKQTPVSDVDVTAISGSVTATTKSDASGFFSVILPESFRARRQVTFRFSHSGYRPLELNETIGKLYVIDLQPIATEKPPAPSHGPVTSISNVRVRYSVKTTTELNVGSEVRTLQVANRADVPCNGQQPCSPDGKWKASTGTITLDAGQGNDFQNARASCIAGPCPFTMLTTANASDDGRLMKVVATNWADTATFLVEGEVVHPMISDLVRESYPVIFGQTMTFSLPEAAEGPSLEADVNSDAIVFPLGPDLFLDWAQCTLEISKDQHKVYRCELRPGYRFK